MHWIRIERQLTEIGWLVRFYTGEHEDPNTYVRVNFADEAPAPRKAD